MPHPGCLPYHTVNVTDPSAKPTGYLRLARVDRLFSTWHYVFVVQIRPPWRQNEPGLTELVRLNSMRGSDLEVFIVAGPRDELDSSHWAEALEPGQSLCLFIVIYCLLFHCYRLWVS